MALGNAAMDKTHEDFVHLLGAIFDAVRDGDAICARRLVDELTAQTEKHFAEEERLMALSACPSTATHVQQHASVLKLLREVIPPWDDARYLPVLQVVTEELQGWFMLHARTLDAELDAHIKSKS